MAVEAWLAIYPRSSEQAGAFTQPYQDSEAIAPAYLELTRGAQLHENTLLPRGPIPVCKRLSTRIILPLRSK